MRGSLLPPSDLVNVLKSHFQKKTLRVWKDILIMTPKDKAIKKKLNMASL